MQVINNKIIFEMRPCLMCNAKGTREERVQCPNYGLAMRGKACVHCKSTTKHDHGYIPTGQVLPCSYCNGAKEVMETNTDYLSKDAWQSIQFTVFRSDRRQTTLESLLGAGCYSCTDYGTHKTQSDAELIANVRKSSVPQICKVIDKDNNLLPVGIFCNNNGYSVVAYRPNAEDTSKPTDLVLT